MSSVQEQLVTKALPHIECGNCCHALPLRLSDKDEHLAVWRCAHCNMSFSAVCLKDQLVAMSNTVRLDKRYFNTSGIPPISRKQQQEAAQFAKHPAEIAHKERRRSNRVKQSLPVSGISLTPDLNPIGQPLQTMVVDISHEGIGLIATSPIFANHIALQLSPSGTELIQVIVRLVREVELTPQYYEYGGEFVVRLGYGHA